MASWRHGHHTRRIPGWMKTELERKAKKKAKKKAARNPMRSRWESVSNLVTAAQAKEIAHRWKRDGYAVKIKKTKYGRQVFASRSHQIKNPTALLFNTRAAALTYVRTHGVKRFSIQKLARGR